MATITEPASDASLRSLPCACALAALDMDDLGVHHPAGHGLDPPDYASLLTTTQAAGEESISELHVVFCAAVAAACLLVPLLTAQALKLLRSEWG